MRRTRTPLSAVACVAILLLPLLCGLPSGARAADVKATLAQVGFHISHPAKEYDARLLPGGAKAVLHLEPAEIGQTRVDVRIAVDQFNSDNTMRDSHMMEVLEGLVFPAIEWKAAVTSGASGPLKPGKFEVRAKGPLTVHGVTRELEVPVTVEVAENGLIGVSSKFDISLESFGIERPTLIFVPIADTVPVTVSMTFPAGQAAVQPSVPAPAPAPAPAAESGGTP